MSASVQDYVGLFGFPCEQCGHQHGAGWGFICIGCPCPRRSPSPVAIEHIREVLLKQAPAKEADRG